MVVPFRLPEHGYRPDIWYFLLVAQSTIYAPSMERFRRIFDVAGEVKFSRLQLQDDSTPESRLLPAWHLVDYGEDVLLTIQGTQNFTQLNAQLMPAGVDHWEGPGRVHVRYLTMARGIFAQIQPVLAGRMPRRILIQGHSMGAAVAQLLAVLIDAAWPGSVERVIGWGSPMCGDFDYASGYALRLLSVAAQGDIVPLLPSATDGTIFTVFSIGAGLAGVRWRPSGTQFLIHSDGAVMGHWSTNQFPALKRSVVLDWSLIGDVASPLPNHSTYTYAVRVRSNLPERLEDLSPRLAWVDPGMMDVIAREFAEYAGTPFRIRPPGTEFPLADRFAAIEWERESRALNPFRR